jgi:hypothetical protein
VVKELDSRLISEEDKRLIAWVEFAQRAAKLLYGPEELRDAWEWFKEGWFATVARGRAAQPTRAPRFVALTTRVYHHADSVGGVTSVPVGLDEDGLVWEYSEQKDGWFRLPEKVVEP